MDLIFVLYQVNGYLFMNKHDLISWKKGFEAAHKAERALISREGADCERSVQLVLSLINTCRRMGIWNSKRKDCLREKEIESVRQQWKRLKENTPR